MKARKRGKRQAREVRGLRLWEEAAALARTLVLTVMCVHVASKLGGGSLWGLAGAGVALAIAFGKRQLLDGPMVWAILAIVLGCLAFGHAGAANHTYLQGYIALALALCSALLTPPEQTGAAAFNARLLIVCVMAFAVTQKAVSTDFRDGSYLSYMLLTGHIGDLAWRGGALPEVHAAHLRNEVRESNFKPTSKSFESESIEFENPYGRLLPTLVMVLTVTIIASEALLAIAFAWRPNAWPAHALLIAFAATLVLIRPEAMFIATLFSLGALVAQKSGDARLVQIYCVAGLIALTLSIAGLPDSLIEV